MAITALIGKELEYGARKKEIDGDRELTTLTGLDYFGLLFEIGLLLSQSYAYKPSPKYYQY